jgi:plasmid stability protein
MPKVIQIRDVPDSLHRVLKSRAAIEGMSLSDYVKRELQRAADRPTVREWLETASEFRRIRMKKSAAQVIRELREPRA